MENSPCSTRCLHPSPLSDRFFPALRRGGGVILLGWVFFSGLFFFPGKREIKAVPSPWLSDLTGSPHYVFSFLLCLLLSTMCLASAGVGDSLERILPPFLPPGPCTASLPPEPPCPCQGSTPSTAPNTLSCHLDLLL